jgi:D-3-phosphoglycerate dehydrogenase
MSELLKVLVTDYAWSDLDEERAILEPAGATLVVAHNGDEEELAALAPDADGILTCWKLVTRRVIESAPRCVAIGRYGIGLDNIDVGCATSSGIIVTNVPAYCLEEVSDHAMALILACSRKTAFYNWAIKTGTYDLKAGTPLYRLSGKTLGILGFGKIGRVLARKATAFGMRIMAHDPLLDSAQIEQHGAEAVSFDDLLARSDFLSIHVPLTPQTRHLFDGAALQKMKPTAYLINTSRGDVVNPEALRAALDAGWIAGAALDVLSVEPPPADDPLVLHPKTIMTPHAAFNSIESLIDLRRTAASQMADVFRNARPSYVVNPEVLGQPNVRARIK